MKSISKRSISASMLLSLLVLIGAKVQAQEVSWTEEVYKSSLQKYGNKVEDPRIIESSLKPEKKETKSLVFQFKEWAWNDAAGTQTDWVNVPVKVVSYPITKVQYEVFQPLIAVATESVTRSPIHNALGTIDSMKQSGNLFKTGILEMFRGLLNPKKAGLVDGALGLLDSAWKLVTGVSTGVVKSVVSIPAYTVARIAGMEPSRYSGISGKRAAIIKVDTGFPIINLFIDPYGDQIIRYHMKGVVDYYCVYSAVEGDRSDCLDKIPEDIETVDFIALTHSGGTYSNERNAEFVAKKLNKKIGLVLSIGCHDSTSDYAHPDDTMGQKGFSWAVQYYLSAAVAKRLRGIPMQEAANQAFNESLPVNFFNPISIGGMLITQLEGSKPRTLKFNENLDVPYVVWSEDQSVKKYSDIKSTVVTNK